MAGVLDGVDQRTQLVGQNRLELLLFNLGGRQRYGINVFKVQEVIHCPSLTSVPNSNPIVRGIANMRGRTIPVMDLAKAIGKPSFSSLENSFVIIAEYNRAVQGFLVAAVDRIVNLNWEEIMAPPKGIGKENFLTAVTRVDNEIVEIIDVEKVLAELLGDGVQISEETKPETKSDKTLRALVADDSTVALKQIKRTLDQIGIECELVKNGREALKWLQEAAANPDVPLADRLDLVISDVEMPEMDGYTLTTEIRKDDRLKHLPVLLHTSLSGVFNQNMVQKVGADKFVAKFNADDLASEVMQLIDSRRS